MAFIANPNGSVTVYLHDKAGNRIDTFSATRSFFTNRKQQESKPPSSADWFNQVYVADTDQGLLDLFKKEPVASEIAFGSTGTSRKVVFCIARGGRIECYPNQSVIAVGDQITGAAQDVYLTRELYISPVEIEDGNKLYCLWQKQTAKFAPK